jgi:hypothetical protein
MPLPPMHVAGVADLEALPQLLRLTSDHLDIRLIHQTTHLKRRLRAKRNLGHHVRELLLETASVPADLLNW